MKPLVQNIYLRNRWLSYLMINNHYLDSSIQKAFMPTTPGCVKHHLKLAAILAEAKKKHKSLAVCWLNLANAYTGPAEAKLNCSGRVRDCMRKHAAARGGGRRTLQLGPNYATLVWHRLHLACRQQAPIFPACTSMWPLEKSWKVSKIGPAMA